MPLSTLGTVQTRSVRTAGSCTRMARPIHLDAGPKRTPKRARDGPERGARTRSQSIGADGAGTYQSETACRE